MASPAQSRPAFPRAGRVAAIVAACVCGGCHVGDPIAACDEAHACPSPLLCLDNVCVALDGGSGRADTGGQQDAAALAGLDSGVDSGTQASNLDAAVWDGGAIEPRDAGRADASGGFVITCALTPDKSSLQLGDTVTATVTYTNQSSSALVIQALVIAGRRPGATHTGGINDDLSPTTSGTVPATGTLSLTASRTWTASDVLGTWEIYSTWEDGADVWHDGPSVYLAVQDGACTPESISAFCNGMGKNCDSVTGTDNCGNTNRTENCGSSCLSPQTCGGGGILNVCGPVPQPTCTGGLTSNSCYLRGVNVVTYGFCYSNEPQSSYAFLASHGVKLIRLPFEWPHLQPTLFGALDANALAALHTEINRAAAAQMYVVIDNHYCALQQTFGMNLEDYPTGALDDLWKRVSDEFKNDPNVLGYDLVNEPDVSSDALWQALSNSAVATIRNNGDNKLIWVEGNHWAGVEDFAAWIPWITDPNDGHVMNATDNIMYEAHTYPNYTGRWEDATNNDYNTSPDHGTFVSRLSTFTGWLQQHGQRGVIGEVSWPSDQATTTWQDWNTLGDQWYAAADAAGLWVTYWMASSCTPANFGAYEGTTSSSQSPPGIDVAQKPSIVVEGHLSVW